MIVSIRPDLNLFDIIIHPSNLVNRMSLGIVDFWIDYRVNVIIHGELNIGYLVLISIDGLTFSEI